MNMNTLAVTTGQAVPDAPSITVDGKDLEVKLSEDAVRSHLRGLACDYCRESLVRMAAAGAADLYLDGRRPNSADTEAFTTSAVQKAHDANHDAWHLWNDQAKIVKQSIRARENKVYGELKAKGLRGLKLRDEAKKALAKLPKIEVPKLPVLADSHPKVERPVVVKEVKAKKAKGFRSQADEAKSKARTASVNRTLELLNKIGQEQGR